MPAVSNATFLDLLHIQTTLRAPTWKRMAATHFPGLQVLDLPSVPTMGSIEGHPFGAGSLWKIDSPPGHVRYLPRHDHAHAFSVMLQLRGSTHTEQQGNSGQLQAGEICLIDGTSSFDMRVANAGSEFLFLKLPRQMVVARFPYLARSTAVALDAHDAGVAVLRDVLQSLLDSAHLFSPEQCASTMVAIAQLLGVPKVPNLPGPEEIHWRLRCALAFIDAHLVDPALTADLVAQEQNVSRRWLDEIMLKTLGTSTATQIRMRRLMQAASDLRDPAHGTRTVTDIALSLGFESPSHFTRTFKIHYRCTPRAWRTLQSPES